MGENLRTYNRLLTSQLKEKEEEFFDLKSRYSRLQNRFYQLDYAFKKNLQLHQQQILEIYELRNSQKELLRIDEERQEEFRAIEDRLMRVTKEKEVSNNGLAYWKQAAIDEKKFHEGKYEELVKSYNLRLRDERIIVKNKFKERERQAKIHIQELTEFKRTAEEKIEAIRKKAIVLQGDVDVLRYRTKELAHFFETLPQMNRSLKAIGFHIVEVLKSFNLSNDEYDGKMKELSEALIQYNSASTLSQESDTKSDYESLKEQNVVLREVVKKLKNDLSHLKKSEAIVPDRLAEEKSGMKDNSSEEIISYIKENEKLRNLIALKNEQTDNLDRKKKETNYETKNGNATTVNKFVQTEERLVRLNYSKNDEESREFVNQKSSKAYWMQREKKIEKVLDRETRDEIKSSELNFGSFNCEGRNFAENDAVSIRGKDKISETIHNNIDSVDTDHPRVYSGRFDPVESHLNTIRYKEYTIPFGKKDNLKIRHPISDEEILKLFSVRSEDEYQNTSADKAVLYFNFENVDVAPFPKILSRLTNCGIQTLPIETSNVFSQTIISKESSASLAGIGVKMLNSERRAIERSLRDLEKTVSEASKETLEEARSFIVSSTKFPPSEEFFDCIQYLSKSCGNE